MGRNVPLKVLKADGSIEGYVHTKVMGTLSRALAESSEGDIGVAEQLAEAVTYYLYHKQGRQVSSGEILSMVKAVLGDTGYGGAAVALSEHFCHRKLSRSRAEVVSSDSQQDSARSRWDKSIIVDGLVVEHGIERCTARAIASMVEEKVFRMGISLIPSGLIKQLVLNDMSIVLRAERQLAGV